MRGYLFHLQEFWIQRSCARNTVRLVLTFDRHLLEKTKPGMSSSDSMSTSSSSESTESEKSKDRGLMTRVRVLRLLQVGCQWRLWGRFGRIPPKSWKRATGRRKAATGGWLLMFVINRLYSGGPANWTLGWIAHLLSLRVSVGALFL